MKDNANNQANLDGPLQNDQLVTRENKRAFATWTWATLRLRRFWRNTNTAWHAARKIEKVNFCSLIISIIAGLLHTIHTSSNVLGGPPLMYLEIQTVLVIFGLVLLLLHSYQKLGGAIQTNERSADEHRREIAVLKSTFEERIDKLLKDQSKTIKCMNEKHATAIKTSRAIGKKRREIC